MFLKKSLKKLISPKLFKPLRGELGVDDSVFDVGVTEIALNGAGIVTMVGEVETGAMAKHVRMNREFKMGVVTYPEKSLLQIIFSVFDQIMNVICSKSARDMLGNG